MDNFSLSGKTLLKNISTFFILEKLSIYQEAGEWREVVEMMRNVSCLHIINTGPGLGQHLTLRYIAGNKFNVSRAVSRQSRQGQLRVRRTVLERNLLLCLYGQTITIHTSVISGLFYLFY